MKTIIAMLFLSLFSGAASADVNAVNEWLRPRFRFCMDFETKKAFNELLEYESNARERARQMTSRQLTRNRLKPIRLEFPMVLTVADVYDTKRADQWSTFVSLKPDEQCLKLLASMGFHARSDHRYKHRIDQLNVDADSIRKGQTVVAIWRTADLTRQPGDPSPILILPNRPRLHFELIDLKTID